MAIRSVDVCRLESLRGRGVLLVVLEGLSVRKDADVEGPFARRSVGKRTAVVGFVSGHTYAGAVVEVSSNARLAAHNDSPTNKSAGGSHMVRGTVSLEGKRYRFQFMPGFNGQEAVKLYPCK